MSGEYNIVKLIPIGLSRFGLTTQRVSKMFMTLIKYTTINTQSPQKWIGILDRNFNALTISKICWCFLSTTEFCWGVATMKIYEPYFWKTLVIWDHEHCLIWVTLS